MIPRLVARVRPVSEFKLDLALAAVKVAALTAIVLLATAILFDQGPPDQGAVWWMVAGNALLLVILVARSEFIASRERGVKGILDARHHAALTLESPVADALVVICDLLEILKAMEVACTGVEHPELIARTGFACFGRELRFTLHPNRDSTVEFHVESRPRKRSVISDGGRGIDQLEHVVNAIRWREVRQRLAC